MTAREILRGFQLASEPGNERLAMEEVASTVEDLGLPERTLERLKTAVAEATMNAMEHGNGYGSGKPVVIEVVAADGDLSVSVTDQGEGPPEGARQTPDIEAKLEGRQKPRGWGLFLVESMVDEMNVIDEEEYYTVELIFHLKEPKKGGP